MLFGYLEMLSREKQVVCSIHLVQFRTHLGEGHSLPKLGLIQDAVRLLGNNFMQHGVAVATEESSEVLAHHIQLTQESNSVLGSPKDGCV